MKTCGDCKNWMKSSECKRERQNRKFNMTVPKKKYKSRRFVSSDSLTCNDYNLSKKEQFFRDMST